MLQKVVEFFSDVYPFKVIKSEQCGNVFYENLDSSKIQYIKCQQLLSKKMQCTNKRPDVDN